MNSLVDQYKKKDVSCFNNETWYLFAEQILKRDQDVYDIIDEISLTTHHIMDEIFSSYYSKGKISFFASIVIVCKFIGLKKEISFIERKKTFEMMVKRIPIVLDYPNFGKDLMDLMDRFTKLHYNDTNESIFQQKIMLTTSKCSLRDLVASVDLKLDFLRIWKISMEEATLYYPSVYRAIQSDSWCPVCYESKCEIALFKCRHLICKGCHIRSKPNECCICNKEVTNLLEYITLDSDVSMFSQVKNKKVIAIIGDLPNSIKGYEHHSMLIKMIKNQKITLIHDHNFCFIYFSVSLNSREQSEKALNLASWISRHVIDSFGITWKTIFSSRPQTNLISHHRFYYLVHFVDIYNQKYMYSLIDPGNYGIHQKILREKDVETVSKNFESILNDFEKPCIKAEISLLRYYIKGRAPVNLVSPIVAKCLDRFTWIRDEPISIIKYLVLMIYKESIDLYAKFHVVDIMPMVCQAYIINLLQNNAFSMYYKDALVGWGYKNILEVFESVIKSEPFEEVAKFHSNLSFHQVREKLEDLMYDLYHISRIPKASFDLNHGFGSLYDVRYPIWLMHGKLSEMTEIDKDTMLKIMQLEHPSLVPVFGYKLDREADLFGFYYCDYPLWEVKKLPIKDEQFALSIAQGLLYLHQRGFVHGNVNSKTIFVRDERPALGCIGKNEMNKSNDARSDVYQYGMLLIWYVLREIPDQDQLVTLLEKLKPKTTPKYFSIVQKCFDIPEFINFDTIQTILTK